MEEEECYDADICIAYVHNKHLPNMLDIDDDYDHVDDSVEYILENVLMPDDSSIAFKRLRDEYNSQLLHSCVCCGQHSCCDEKSSCHNGSYTQSMNVRRQTELVLKKNLTIPAIIECNQLCACFKSHCENRCVQLGPRKKLEIFNSTTYKSKGLRTTENIPCGAFICEYAGELLTFDEAQRRLKYNDKHGLMNYILCLNEYVEALNLNKSMRVQTTIVDPSRHGNIGRYLNHSCEPNCDVWPVRVDSPVPKIGIFANRDIAANEELCFHYGGNSNTISLSPSTSAKSCLCSSSSCTGNMPNIRITET